MKVLNVLCVGILMAGLSGCGTMSSSKAPNSQMHIRILDLEKKLAAKEREISDLKYELNDLSGRVEDNQREPMNFSNKHYIEEAPSSVSYPSVKSDDGIVRVNISAVELQTALKDAGYYEGKIDGKIGRQTKKAIVNFQKDHDLKADGIVGKNTWAQLGAYLE